MFLHRTLVGGVTKSLFKTQYSNALRHSFYSKSQSRSFCSASVTTGANVIQELKSRGFIYQMTASEQEMIDLTNAKKPISLYAGFDPTADSLHIGNLLSLMVLLHFKRHGHNPIALVGGATALIGDPSGKSTDRPLLDTDFIANNIKYIRENITAVLGGDVQLVNNYDWNKDISIIHFLRDIGTFFRVGSMIKKDFIQNRIGNNNESGNDPNGISYTEFSYALLQSNDFLHLRNTQDCMIQIGGSDQWGNITDGCELIKKKTGKPGYGITIPLLTNSQGKKLGKSEGNSIWLAPHRTSPFYFYQYWIQVTDQDIERFLKLFTLHSLEEINAIVQQHNEAPHKRIGQKAIAEGVTTIVHGKRGLEEAISTTDLLFGNKLQESKTTTSDGFDIGFLLSRANAIEMPKSESMGVRVVDIFAKVSNMSKGQVKTLIGSKSLYINSEPITDIQTLITPEALIADQYMIFRYGKKAYYLVKFI
ncbi:hypothetical protein CYY_007071 [Polysphondylium violaceum]|uniref:Tyrosine--tRNA ligase n=1 Tax=Polysphondylium violaceum TaxID=133409 RepID=A0A8J4UY94_9MYCE|nr:hypothetical protein CYY_007071 [Polysphondylium violaceum]